MRKRRNRLLAAVLICLDLGAQTPGGYVIGSLESNSIGYIDDSGLGTEYDNHFGSNNYLKLDYVSGRFSAGLQGEAYLPALLGYEIDQQMGAKSFFLASKYVRWQDNAFSFQVGDIYEQFGSGLVFRSHEDRQLGFNNSVEGVAASWNFGGYLSVKGLAGRPRLYCDYAGSMVRGADIDFSLSRMLGLKSFNINLEGSFVNRYEALTGDLAPIFDGFGLDTPNLNLYSGSVNIDWNDILSFKGEYAAKSKDICTFTSSDATNGSAILASLSYNDKGLSFSGTFRRLEKMGTMLSLYGTGTGNTLNYLPALTRQYTYMLANLNPYQVNVEGEIGGQIDAYYTLRSHTDRHRKWIFHANFSQWYTLLPEQTKNGGREKLWQDFNIDIERQWGSSLKTNLLVTIQEWNPSHGYEHRTYVSNIVVADVLYKFDRKRSIRAEAQYLYSQEFERDWVAGLLEFSVAPKWSVFFSDMYNLGTTKKNYYSGGFGYTAGSSRLMLSYGRNRAGYVCSGGVCRYSPAYTGVNLTLTTSF